MIRKLGQEPLKTKNDYHRPQDTWVEPPFPDNETGAAEPRCRVRNLRSRRTIFTLAVTAFTVGALIIIGTSPYKNDFMAPGPLCSSHAQILGGQGADRCAACHGASDQTLASWVADALTGGRTIPVSQSDLCMKCHEKSISPDFALNPHSVARTELQNRTEKFKKASFASSRQIVQSLSSPPVNGHSEIACSACHREHHGLADLSAITDQQCQSCHAQVFDSFESNHPEFTNWPLQRRSRIAFDHSTHAGKHFPGKGAEFNCNQCHVSGPYGNVKLLASFEKSCAECHAQQIQQSGGNGFAIFALPSIDPQAIESQGLSVGSWPLSATGDFDGRIPPAMCLLLQADPVAQPVLDRMREKFGNEIDFADVDPSMPEDVADAVELVWAIKRLLYDLASDGQEAIRSRLSEAIVFDVQVDQVASLAGELDENVFRNTIRRWLPDLQQEVSTGRDRQAAWLSPDSVDHERTESLRAVLRQVKFLKVAAGDDDLLVPNPLKDLFPTVKTDSPTLSSNDDSTAVDEAWDGFSSENRSQNATESQVAETGPVTRKPLRLKDADASSDKLATDSDLLAINPLNVGEGDSDVGVSIPTDLTTDSDSDESAQRTDQGGHQQKFTLNEPSVLRAGWYRDDQMFRVFYRPSGHADECVKAWSDLAASVIEGNIRPESQPLFDQFLASSGVGLCATCHTVDQMSDASFQVNWAPEYRDPAIGAFTKFSHQPHTLQPHLRDCAACHDMSQPVSNKDSFVSHDPRDVVSNFAPITKMNCVSCHRTGSTNSGCTHCHSYHVGSNAIKPSEGR